MTDLTQYYVNSQDEELVSKSQGVIDLQGAADQEQEEKETVIMGKANSAYDATDLGSTGPTEKYYNYENAYKDGNTFKTDEGGGVGLKNKNFNPGYSTVAGRDLNTGKQYDNQWEDKDGDIEKGRQILTEGEFNTITGSTYDQTDGLFNVANGIYKEGGDFDSYVDAVKGPWNNDQLAMGWNAAKHANDTMTDIDTQGKRFYDEMREEYDQFEGVVTAIPAEGYTEETLAADPTWIENSRKLGDYIFGKGANADKTDEEIAESSKFLVSQLRNNFDISMFWANRIIQSEDPELARTWLALDAQYEAMDTSLESVGRWTTAQANVTNLLTFGGGVLITNLGKFSMQAGVKAAMQRAAGVAGVEAGLGGAAGGAEDVMRQKTEITGGVREEIDLGQTAAMVGISALLTGGVGFGMNSASNKDIRSFAANKAGKGMKFLQDNMQPSVVTPMKGQRGSVGIPVTGDQQVEASFKLQELLTGSKDGAKPITIQENIKAAVNKGLITEQEVKWSGVNEYLDEVAAKGGKVNRAEMENIVEAKTPKPELVDTETTQYSGYSLMTNKAYMDEDLGAALDPAATMKLTDKRSAYRERMLVIKGGGNSQYTPDHFQLQQQDKLSPVDNMIGHSRVEASKLDDDPGKMVLEIQSDFHKEGQQGGYVDERGELVGGGPVADERDSWIADVSDMERVLLGEAHKYNIDPYSKNAQAQLWPYLDEPTKNVLVSDKPKLQPYGKDWDAMGMRLEIMDSINNGDEFVAFPASADQINTIEKWGAAYTNEGIVKRATTDRVKAMKKMGLTVEQVDMPQYKDVLSKNTLDMYDGDAEEQLQQSLRTSRQLLWYDPYEDIHMVTAYPNEADWTRAQKLWDQDNGYVRGRPGEPLYDEMSNISRDTGDLISVLESPEDMMDLATAHLGESEPGSTVFNVIRLTPEVKARFRKEGMKMYGAGLGLGGAGAAVEEKAERKRDANGRFSK